MNPIVKALYLNAFDDGQVYWCDVDGVLWRGLVKGWMGNGKEHCIKELLQRLEVE